MRSRPSGHEPQILASARSPCESFVPPLLTRLKMSTTTSMVLSAPVTSSTWRSISQMPRMLVQASDELAPHVGVLGQLAKPGDVLTEPRVPLLHQRRGIDPERVILHLRPLVEAELFGLDVKVEVGEGPPALPSKKAGGAPRMMP